MSHLIFLTTFPSWGGGNHKKNKTPSLHHFDITFLALVFMTDVAE